MGPFCLWRIKKVSQILNLSSHLNFEILLNNFGTWLEPSVDKRMYERTYEGSWVGRWMGLGYENFLRSLLEKTVDLMFALLCAYQPGSRFGKREKGGRRKQECDIKESSRVP